VTGQIEPEGTVARLQLVAGGRYAAYAPAAVGLTLFVAVVQIRMDGPWAAGVLCLVAAVPAAALLAAGLRAARDEEAGRAAVTLFLVAGLVLAAVALARLGDILGDDDWLADGGTFTLMIALFCALAAFVTLRSRSAACLLLAALAAVGLALEAVNWIFDTENVDTFRVLLAVAFAALFAAGVAVGGRSGTILVAAAGVTVLASGYVLGIGFFGADLDWGWELVTLAEGLALVAYAARRLEPGPGYLAFFVLALFAATAAISGETGGLFGSFEDPERPSPSLVGWPLALAIGTTAAALWGHRATRRSS
jgi:peptidoglycan/LPS O-acetylase OafA/YrhL